MIKLRLSIGLCLLLGLVAKAPAVQAQEIQHAPTVDQCTADEKLWGSYDVQNEYQEAESRHLRDGIPNHTDIARLSILQLTSRGKEMNDCARVVTAQPFLDVANFYLSVVEDRYSSFVKRHGLMKQMVKEDVEGQR